MNTKSETESQPTKKGGFSWKTLSSFAQLLISVLLVVSALVWMVLHPTKPEERKPQTDDSASLVDLTNEGLIRVPMDTPLGKRLTRFAVAKSETTEPLIRTTGMVIASRRPGTGGQSDFWQFSSEELLTNYADWDRARTDAEFNRVVANQVQALGDATENGLRIAIERMEKLVRTGTETTRDLEGLKTQLIQSQLQTKKDLYEAEAAIRIAKKSLDTLGLKLARFGLEPDWLQNATSDMDVIAIEVPEGVLNRVQHEQTAEAKFYGLPEVAFTGQVHSVSPVLSTEQRTLRVIVVLHDPDDRLRPGMYANVGLGTDKRNVTKLPASSVIHIGDHDYVLQVVNLPNQGNDPGDSSSVYLKPIAIQIKGSDIDSVEIENVMDEGSEIIGDHTILLKPLVVRVLKRLSVISGKQTDQQ